MKNRILFLDTETGGIDPSNASLLSIGLAVWSDNQIISTKEIFIKHEIFKVSPKALSVNKINLQTFINKAIDPRSAIEEIKKFCSEHFLDGVPITLGGHNTNFDINFLKYFFSDNRIDFNDLFSHRFVDTASILKFLYYAGKIEEDISSSSKAFSYFNISIDKRHSALGDAIGTAQLFTELVKLLKGSK